jgi:hypothetical protein
MADTRIFRVTRYTGRMEYCNRIAASGKCGGNGDMGRDIRSVHATNAEATEGWTDVTAEFRPLGAMPKTLLQVLIEDES